MSRPRIHFEGAPDFARWRTLSTMKIPGTLTEQFDESAIGKAVANQQLATLVDTYGLETVARWLGTLAAVKGLKLELTRS